MTGASSSRAASTTARAISRLLTLKEGTANRFSKTYLRNNRGFVTNISFCKSEGAGNESLSRNVQNCRVAARERLPISSIARRVCPYHFVRRRCRDRLIPGARRQEGRRSCGAKNQDA